MKSVNIYLGRDIECTGKDINISKAEEKPKWLRKYQSLLVKDTHVDIYVINVNHLAPGIIQIQVR